MKKHLFAASVTTALAVTSASVAAESSVTLYGVIDTGLGYAKVSGDYRDPKTGAVNRLDNSHVGMTNGTTAGSRWGLRGKEDLGGGLYATFKLESGFNSANGTPGQNNRLFGRDAVVGLTSADLGKLEFGRQFNIGTQYMLSLFGANFGNGFTQWNTGAGLGLSGAAFGRYDNMVLYETPSMGGLTAAISYSSNIDDKRDGETGFATADNTRAVTAGLRYLNGPLAAFLSYDQLNGSNKLSQPSERNATPRSYLIGASYDFEVVKLLLAYGRTTDGWFGGSSLPAGAAIGKFSGIPTNAFVDGFKSNSYLAGISAPVGAAGSMFASWQRADANNSRLTSDDATTNTFSLGYTYSLSKRTAIYGLASYTNNYAFLKDAKYTDVSVGLRHAF